jgi:MYXO-CTERM domain-containing protein
MKLYMWGLGVGVAGLASMSLGQVGTGGTITSGNTSFTIADYLGNGAGSGPTADLHVGGSGNPDQLQQAWWWFRAEGDARETAFSNATSATFSGANGRANYSYSQFDANMIWRVQGFGDGRGLLTQTLTIHNTTSSVLTIQLFNYNDITAGGTNGDDTATQIAPNAIRADDSAGTGWKIAYEGTEVFDMTNGSFNVLNLLTDGSADLLQNRALPAGSGPFQAAYMWTITLNPNEAATASSTVTITPTPGAMALLGLGGLAMVRRRR